MTQTISSRLPARSGEQGFTLVELAIVLIIIGLLIGGILKGQELIANAQIKSVVSQIKGYDAAVTTFRDSYGSLPGDMPGPAAVGPTARLPNCPAASVCATLGNGSNTINTPATFGNVPAVADEAFVMWAQLDAADIISGITGAAISFAQGGGMPGASVGGGFWAEHTATGVLPASTDAAAGRQGHYFIFNGTPVNVAVGTGGLQPLQAERIDRTLDDGLPNVGTVRASGAVGCAPAGAASLYNSGSGAVAAANCALYIRFQG